MGDRPVLRIRAPENRVAERKYVFEVVFAEWLGIDYHLELDNGSNVRVGLVGDPRGSLITFPDVFFAIREEDWLTTRSLPRRPLLRALADSSPSRAAGAMTSRDGMSSGGSLPVVYGVTTPSGQVWRETEAGEEFSVDIYGSIFFFLTRYEEAVLQDRDRDDRFPSSASLAASEGLIGRPLVDDYVDVLWASMMRLWPRLERRPSTFRLRLTHDVDEPWAARRRRAVIGDAVIRRDPRLAARRIRAIYEARLGRFERDPFDTFDLLMDISERHGLQSEFNFMATNKDDPDFRYNISDRRIARVLARVHERGHEVGLHSSYDSFRSQTMIRFEFEALRRACASAGFDQATWGVRQHYLRFENPLTWRSQDQAGLDHDSTLGWRDEIGFRAGTCREYPVFDLLGRRQLRLRERPLLIMDSALLSYVARDREDALVRARAMVDECRQREGDAVLLFHNHIVGQTHQADFYRHLIEDSAAPIAARSVRQRPLVGHAGAPRVRSSVSRMAARVEFAMRPRRFRLFRDYMASEFEPLDIRRARQDASLARMLTYAERAVPHYRQVFANTGIHARDVRAVGDLAALPVLTKTMIRNEPDSFVPQMGEPSRFLEGRTGGSTGQPLRYRMSIDDYEAGVALLYRGFSHVGYRPGDSMVIVAGGSLTSNSPGLTDRARDLVTNRRTLSSYGMSPERMAAYLDLISRWCPQFVRGYASSLLALSRFALRHDMTPCPSVRAVFSTAENLAPSARSMIEQAFGCEVIDGYGLNDGGVSATECTQHSGFHVDMERAVLEVVDDTGRPVVDRPGRILATSLLNRAMPFVRYDTGDIGVMISKTCSCGRTGPLLSAILGRETDLLVISGVTIGSPVLTVLMGTTSAVWYQIVQTDESSVVFRIVNPNLDTREDDEATVSRSMHRHVGGKARVTFEYLDMPDDLLAGDKHRIVINRWQPQAAPAMGTATD